MGARIIGAATFAVETIVNGTAAFDFALGAIGIGRAAYAFARARSLAGGGGLAFHAVHWIDDTDALGAGGKAIQQSLDNNCGQTCASAILSENGLKAVAKIFEHQDVTDAAELASFLSGNGMQGVQHGSATLDTVLSSVQNGKPAMALIENVDSLPHWVIIDAIDDSFGPGNTLLGIRDPSSGQIGWMKQIDFQLNYFRGVAVWTN
jgi:hypothetical protein